MSKKQQYQELLEQILAEIGGQENITLSTHCMTRLRFNLKDQSIPEIENLKAIKGVLGVVYSGGQLQIIIGQHVDKVYEELVAMTGIKNTAQSKVRSEKEKFVYTPKNIANAILDGVAGCLTPLIPMLLAASFFKLLVSIFGPDMLAVINEGNDIYTLLTFVGDAGFYFFPIVVGYTAAKKFGATPVVAMFLGGIMLHPTFTEMAAEGISFSVFGIPSAVQDYSSTIVPVILSVWVMSYVERFFKKILPTTLKTIFAPSLTILIMLPLALCVLGPAGAVVGDFICNGLLSFADVGGFLAIAVIAALYEFLVMSGMHLVLISSLILVFSTNGSEALVSPAATVASFAVAGMCLGAALRIKEKEQKSISIGFLIASIIGGVTEPGLYGVGMRYKRPFIGMAIGGFIGGLYAGIVGVTAHTLVPVANVLAVLNFAGGPKGDFVHGVIASVIGFVAATIATYFLGFKKDDPIVQKQK